MRFYVQKIFIDSKSRDEAHVIQGDTKITVITKNRVTSKILFRLTQNFSCIRSNLCSRHLQDKNLGGSSLVNAATTAGHTCGWSVGQENAAVAMPMIHFRSGGWHHPSGTTGGPWQPLSVDQVLSRTCQALGHIADTQQSLWQQQRCVISSMISVIQSVIVC